MSVSIKVRKFTEAAERKGFEIDRCHDHIYFTYRNSEGKLDNRIYTKVSHGGNGDISPSNLSKMKRQLRFKKMEEFQQYVDCTFTLDQYRALLKSQGLEK